MLASGQIVMRKIDGWNTLSTVSSDQQKLDTAHDPITFNSGDNVIRISTTSATAPLSQYQEQLTLVDVLVAPAEVVGSKSELVDATERHRKK